MSALKNIMDHPFLEIKKYDYFFKFGHTLIEI